MIGKKLGKMRFKRISFVEFSARGELFMKDGENEQRLINFGIKIFTISFLFPKINFHNWQLIKS